MPHSPPTQFGPYHLRRALGQTRAATVYEALTLRGRRVAIKILSKDVAREPEVRARFLETAQLARTLRHPNLVPVFDYGELHDRLFLVMAFVPGEDLGKRVHRKGRLSWSEVMQVGKEVCQALSYMHSRNVVHGDVKPSNLMRLRNGRIILMDMGIAKMQGARFSQSGLFALGSPAYMPPEQIEGRSVDGRADQYALAATLYELLCGEPPFKAENVAVMLYRQLHEAPPPLSAKRVPPTLAAAILRALAKLPEMRFTTMSAFQQALGAATAPGKKRFAQSFSLIAAAVFIAALIVGLVMYLGLQTGGQPAPIGGPLF